jgi:peptide/nickel transport system substrate-binding protein
VNSNPPPGRRIDRRKFLSQTLGVAAGAAAIGAGGGILSGCSTTTSFTPRKSAYGGHLDIATWSEDNSLSPPQAQWDQTGYLYANAIFDSLVAIGADGNVHPYLAESVTPNHDYTVWTITARKGISFHDGTPCDGAAIKTSLDAIRGSLLTGSAVRGITGTKLVDPGTVTISLDQPWIVFDSYLASQLGYVAAPSMLKLTNQGGNKPIGTGPFIFDQWVPNDHLTVRKNPNYWQKGYPYLDTITFHPTPDPGARVEAMRSGAVQLMHTNYPPSVKDFINNKSFNVTQGLNVPGAEPDVDFIMLNCDAPPTNDINVRRALAMAIDKGPLEETFGAGLTVPVSGPFEPGSLYYTPTSYPSYDPQGATDLVNQYKAAHGGAGPQIDLATIEGPEYLDLVSLIQQQWEAVGVQVTTDQREQSALITDVVLGNFQAATFEQFSATNPDQNYVWWSTTTYAPVGTISLNLARNDDPLIQSALETGRQDPDPAARIAAYKTVAERLAIDLPYVWLSKTLWAGISQPEVAGLDTQTLPDGSPGLGFSDGVFLLHPLRLNGT